MKNFTQKLKKTAIDFWNDEEAQGMMEYILLAVVVVGAVTLMREPLLNAISGKTAELGDSIGSFQAQ